MGEACDEEGISFCHFITDTFGAWHDRAASETKRLAQATGQPDSQVVSHLIQRFSILVIRGSAILMVNRIPNTDDLFDM